MPLGADQPFDPIPDVTITDDDLEHAADLWDRTMPRRVNGLLHATVTGDDDG